MSQTEKTWSLMALTCLAYQLSTRIARATEPYFSHCAIIWSGLTHIVGVAVSKRGQTPMCKHFSSLYLHDIIYCLIGPSKSNSQVQSQCERMLPKGMDAGK